MLTTAENAGLVKINSGCRVDSQQFAHIISSPRRRVLIGAKLPFSTGWPMAQPPGKACAVYISEFFVEINPDQPFGSGCETKVLKHAF